MKILLKIIQYAFILIVLMAIGISAIYWRNDIPLATLKEKYTNEASKFVEIDGMSVHYRDEGIATDTIPVVLIHGTGASLHTWEGWVQALKGQHRIIRLDLPAYGLTGANSTGDYSQEFYTEFLHRFLTKIGVKQCILGGNSLGGAITWGYALKYPSTVDKMILIDAGGYPMQSKSVPIAFQIAGLPLVKNLFKYVTPRSVVEQSIKNLYVQKEKVTSTLVDRYFELSLREGNREAFINRIGQRMSDSSYLNIKTLQMPTLIIWGEEDLFIPLDVAEKFHRDLPNDTLVVFKNLGHTPMEEDASQTVAVVQAFLKKTGVFSLK